MHGFRRPTVCIHCSAPFYISTWASTDVGIHGGFWSQSSVDTEGQMQLSLGGIKSYTWILDCAEVSAPDPCVVQGSAVHFHHVISRLHTVNMTYHGWCYIHYLAETSFRVSPLLSVFSPFSSCTLWKEGSHRCSPYFKEWGISSSWGQDSCINYFKCFCTGDWSILPIYLWNHFVNF